MTVPFESPVAQSASWDEDIDHLVCDCDENLSLCGVDVSGREWGYDQYRGCPLCELVDVDDCPRCGE